MYKLFLTIRYLVKPLSLVTIGALALSVIIFTAAPSVMNGFQEDFHARVRGTMSDMSLKSDRPLDVPLSPKIENALASVPGVEAVAPFIEHPALDRQLNKIDYCMIRGIRPEQEERVGEFRKFVLSDRDWFLEREGFDVASPERKKDDLAMAANLAPVESDAETELADAKKGGNPDEIKAAEKRLEKAKAHIPDLYRKLAEGVEDPMEPTRRLPAVLAGIFFLSVYNLEVGMTVKLTTAAGEGTEIQQDREFVIVGAFKAGSHDTDRRTLYMDLKTAQKFIGTDRVSGYAIKLKDYNQARVTKRACARAGVEAVQQVAEEQNIPIRSRYVNVWTWEEQNENLLRAVGMERLLIRLITFMIVLAASATIFLVLVMTIQFKVRELGILRAVGGSWKGTLLIFLGQGFLLAFIGMILGSALGLLGAHYINELADFIHKLTGWHPFPPEVYYLERIPSKIYWSELATNAVITLALGFVFSVFPALVAALRPPIRAIRND
jgi:ABC-type lipoprotein release transport system permease subunit